MKSNFSYFKSFLSLLATIPLFVSCEKDITVDLPQPEEKIVVEGYISPGAPAYVFISRSVAFFAPSDSASLLQYTIKNALVTISDGIAIDTLVAPSASVGYLYVSPNITGQAGKTYTLNITLEDGRQLSSVTNIPLPVPLDSLWFKQRELNDGRGWIWARLSDPPVEGNYYRWFAKRLNEDNDFIAPYGSVNSDKFFNGLSFDFAYNRGSAPYAEEDEEDENVGYFLIGDTVVVKFASITRESYDFWRSAEAQTASNGSPFASPSPLKSNINGGVGIWEGFSYTLDTVIAQ